MQNKQEVFRVGTENRQIQMVVFDWAGTTVDYGSSAPSVVFDRVLTAAGLAPDAGGDQPPDGP